MKKRYACYLMIIGLIVLLDVASKAWATQNLFTYTPSSTMGSYLAGKVVYNNAIALSIFTDYARENGQALIYLLNMAGLGVTLVLLHKATVCGWRLWLPITGMIGGAVANLADRVQHGAVTDFIVVHYYDIWYSPVFNIADIAITVSGVVVAYRMIRYNEGLRSAAQQPILHIANS